MNQQKIWLGTILVLICTIFTSTGQFFFKLASNTISLELINLITNYYLILGLFSYGIGAMILIIALRFGPLSFLYPFLSLNFIWVMLISLFFFKETIDGTKVLATIFIIIGVIFISKSQNNGVKNTIKKTQKNY